MSSWEEYKLRDLVSFSQGIQVPVEEQFKEKSLNMDRFIRIVDYTNPNEEPRYITTKPDKYKVKKDDVVMIRYGWAGKVVCGLEGYIANNMFRIIVNEKDVLDKKYLYYFLSQKSIYNYLISCNSSTTMPSIKFSDFDKVEIKIPSLIKQKEIVDVLYTFDKKIQLNTQINQTLEQIAQAIFKSWFIDFDPVKAKAEAKAQGSTDEQANIAAMSMISGKSPEKLNAYKQTNPTDHQQLHQLAQAFPSEFEEIDGVEVPKGWEITNFGAVSECFDKKRIPLSKRQREQKIGNIPYYGATSVMDYVNEAIFNDIYLLIGEDGSVLKDDGTPFIQYIWGESWVNNHAHVLKGKDCVSTEHLMLFMSLTNIRSYITGAVQMKLNQANMNRIPFIKATNEINILFSKYISSFYEQIRFFSDENKNLMKVRDLLLPKFLSGDLNA